jgi:hypothetical protein
MVGHVAAGTRFNVMHARQLPRFGNLGHRRQQLRRPQPIPLIRRNILFYDRFHPALPMVIGGLHHGPPRGEDRNIRDRTPGTPRLRPAAVAMPRPAIIPAGSWPRRMRAELAAGYCGEPTVEAFLKRVGSEYPQPRITEGRRRLWLRDDLDQAILPPDLHRVRDVAEDL